MQIQDRTPIGEGGVERLRALCRRKGVALRDWLTEAGHSHYLQAEACPRYKADWIERYLSKYPDKE
jgi:hypothetical protein